MTRPKRWLAVLQRKTPDRVPTDDRATDEATATLLQHLGYDCDTMLRRLHIDTPLLVSSKYFGPPRQVYSSPATNWANSSFLMPTIC